MGDVSQFLFGQTRSRLLATLYDKPETPFYVRQLARQIDGSVGTVQRELSALSAAGLILRSESQNQVFYRANRSHPIFPELSALMRKTTGAFGLLENALAAFSESIEFAFIYGSFARGEESSESDVDLMVVGNITMDEVLQVVLPVEKQLSRPINPTVYARTELQTKLNAGNHFLQAIQGAPLTFLIGNEHEFREIR